MTQTRVAVIMWWRLTKCYSSLIHVAKCNILDKVKLEAMLVSSFSRCARDGPMPLAGSPGDLHMQLLACGSSQSVVAIACCLFAILCCFFPIPSSLFRSGPSKHWLVSIPLNCSVWHMVPGGGCLQGCHGYLLLMLEHCPAPPTL